MGAHSLLAPNARYPNLPPLTPQVPPVAPGNDNATTLVDLVECQMGTVKKLWGLGVRHFLVLGTMPLHLTPLYSQSDEPTIYWTEWHDGKSWHRQVRSVVPSFSPLISYTLLSGAELMLNRCSKMSTR